MLSLAALLTAALWSGVVDEAVVEGARAPGEIKDALRAVDLAGCVDGHGFDVVVDVEFAAAGSVTGVAVVVADAVGSGSVAVPCLVHALEPITLRDRGTEPATHALLRFTDAPAPTALPWPSLKKALKKSHAGIARCVVRLRRVQPGLRGAVLARVHLDDGGRARAVDVEGDNKGLNACVAAELDGLFVDGFADRVVVAPFVFDDVGVDPQTLPASEHRTFFSFIGCDLPIP